MRTVALLALVIAAAPGRALAEDVVAAAGAKNKKLCETTWPAQTKPSPAATFTCTRYWLFNHAGYSAAEAKQDLDSALAMDPRSDGAVVTRFTAAQLEAMGRHVRAACGASCRDEVTIDSRALEFFAGAAASHFTLFDGGSMGSIEPLLGAILAGQRLEAPAEVLAALSPVTLWKLRNAIYARHGRPFKNPDLQRFFYGDRGAGADKTPLLPRPVNAAYRDTLLTKVDRANLAVILEREGRGRK